MGAAPYEVHLKRSASETFVFTLEFKNRDGTDFVFIGQTVEYAVSQNGVEMWSGTSATTGVSISGTDVTFAAPNGTFDPGRYDHECRLRNVSTDELSDVFDGTVTIAEGSFV